MESRYIISIIAILTFCSLIFAAQELENEAEHIGPELLSAIYDYYSVNMFDAKASGMGGISLSGGVESTLANPAALRYRSWHLYL